MHSFWAAIFKSQFFSQPTMSFWFYNFNNFFCEFIRFDKIVYRKKIRFHWNDRMIETLISKHIYYGRIDSRFDVLEVKRYLQFLLIGFSRCGFFLLLVCLFHKASSVNVWIIWLFQFENIVLIIRLCKLIFYLSVL